MLTLVSVMILTSLYYLNLPDEKNPAEESEYLKSEICYYTIQGIKSDYHYHLQLNITINGERIEIPTNIGFEKDENFGTGKSLKMGAVWQQWEENHCNLWIPMCACDQCISTNYAK